MTLRHWGKETVWSIEQGTVIALKISTKTFRKDPMHSIKMTGRPAKSKLDPLFSKWIYMFQLLCWGTICCQITTFSTLVVGVWRVGAALHQADCLSLEVLGSFCVYDSSEWRAPSCSTHSDWFTKPFPPSVGVCVCHVPPFVPSPLQQRRRK